MQEDFKTEILKQGFQPTELYGKGQYFTKNTTSGQLEIKPVKDKALLYLFRGEGIAEHYGFKVQLEKPSDLVRVMSALDLDVVIDTLLDEEDLVTDPLS